MQRFVSVKGGVPLLVAVTELAGEGPGSARVTDDVGDCRVPWVTVLFTLSCLRYGGDHRDCRSGRP
jgi:hypothetical protein